MTGLDRCFRWTAAVALLAALALAGTDAAWAKKENKPKKTQPAPAPALPAEVLERARQAPAPDYLQVARDFADCMIRFGRDRYGRVHSPLFANMLTREKEPRLTPYPLFAEPDRVAPNEITPFARFNFNKVWNYPQGLASAGPHKVTLFGCDPFEDRDLYYALFDLTRITGDPQYKKEADAALTWWFRNTQGPAGLYPWGEHLGWDFEYDCPTYFDGPSKYLYHACFHEIKDDVPFLDILAGLPAGKAGAPTPLERYALGIWTAHFWNKERCYYDRHGDYTGQADRAGNVGGFPAHLAAYLRVWAAAFLNSQNPEIRKEIDAVMRKVLDMAIARTETYGFYPYSFDPEVNGTDPGKETPPQSIRLAYHAAEIATPLDAADPEVAAKLRRFSELHLGALSKETILAGLSMRRETGDAAALDGKPRAEEKPQAVVRDIVNAGSKPDDFATEILRNLYFHKQYGDAEYRRAAEAQARLAYGLFCDDQCPLPKARVDSDRLSTEEGKPFPDFYWQGARLMRAFALLGEALRASS